MTDNYYLQNSNMNFLLYASWLPWKIWWAVMNHVTKEPLAMMTFKGRLQIGQKDNGFDNRACYKDKDARAR